MQYNDSMGSPGPRIDWAPGSDYIHRQQRSGLVAQICLRSPLRPGRLQCSESMSLQEISARKVHKIWCANKQILFRILCMTALNLANLHMTMERPWLIVQSWE